MRESKRRRGECVRVIKGGGGESKRRRGSMRE